jgi:phosphomannomutase/phosphoglucomutase
VRELGAIAGFEGFGHFFFNAPIGRGYDDSLVSALAVLDMLDRDPGRTLAEMSRDLPKTWNSPTMSPHCADEAKYRVVENVLEAFRAIQTEGGTIAGHPLRDVVTVNGVRPSPPTRLGGWCPPGARSATSPR